MADPVPGTGRALSGSSDDREEPGAERHPAKVSSGAKPFSILLSLLVEAGLGGTADRPPLLCLETSRDGQRRSLDAPPLTNRFGRWRGLRWDTSKPGIVDEL
jgi:hypothetical protein